jgi:predicted metalloendopeptidase
LYLNSKIISLFRALSYGAIGHVLGHELTHGFDDTGTWFICNIYFILWNICDRFNSPSLVGRTFNLIGKKVLFKETGWSNVSDRNFKKEEKCLVKQFSGYKVLGKFHVGGRII